MSDLSLPTARDWMRPPAFMLAPGDDVFTAIDQLVTAGVPTAAVLEHGRIVGIFTEKDALRALSHLLYDATAEAGTVADHMSRSFTSCGPEMDFFRVSEIFLGCNFPTLPVVQNEKLVGIVERSALLAAVEQYRRKLEIARSREAAIAGRQADRPRGIGAFQQAAAHTTREQLVRLFSRRQN